MYVSLQAQTNQQRFLWLYEYVVSQTMNNNRIWLYYEFACIWCNHISDELNLTSNTSFMLRIIIREFPSLQLGIGLSSKNFSFRPTSTLIPQNRKVNIVAWIFQIYLWNFATLASEYRLLDPTQPEKEGSGVMFLRICPYFVIITNKNIHKF